MKAIALHSVIPVRAEAAEQSEQVTQILFGETMSVLEQKSRWNRVKLDSDGQEGWVDSKMVSPMSTSEYGGYKTLWSNGAIVKFPMAFAVSENNGQTIPLTAGTHLPGYVGGEFDLLGVHFRVDPTMVAEKPIELNENNLLQVTRFFLNIPYLWGGKNALGMDCSGFTQVVMSLFGKKLPRNAGEQVKKGRMVSLKNAQAGDLAFFGHEGSERVTHVGIVLDSGRILHCSGRVKVEKLDESGIFSPELGGYSHKLLAVRRI